MSLEEKIKNPICIKLGEDAKVMMAGDSSKKYPLAPGVVFGYEHYGFVIITENNGKKQEDIYPTQCKLQVVNFEYSNIKIFEKGKELPWVFDNQGVFKQSASYNEYTNVDSNDNDDCLSLHKEELNNSLVLKKKK